MAEIQTYSIDEPYLPIECRLGEGPLYGEGTDQLRFLDIIKKQIHFLDVKEGPSSHRVVQLDDSVGITADIEGNDEEFIVAAKRGYALFNKKTGKLRYVKKIYEDNPKMADRMRFNDGAVDSKGRFWAGSMNDFHVGEPQPEGCVFRLDTDLTLHRMIENVSIPNGMGWSPDDKTMYFTDSPTRSVFVYDYDSETGTITNKRTFFTLTDEDEAVPDGCTVDTDGHLWIAIHEGSCVIRVSPDGREVARISLKAWRITCPCFGGSEFDELFITSAGVGEDEAKPEGSTDNGSVFRIKTSSTGLRPNKFIMSEKQ